MPMLWGQSGAGWYWLQNRTSAKDSHSQGLLLQETSVEQAFLVVQATDNCAVTQLHNHSTLHKGVHLRAPRVSFSDVCGKGGFPQAFN